MGVGSGPAKATWYAKPNRLRGGLPQGDLLSVGLEKGGIANQAGAGDVGVGDRHDSVRNKGSF